MSEDFRKRVFLPFVLPVAVLVGFLLFAVSLSRVFLAVPEIVATFTAVAVAAYILLIAGLVSARPRISASALGVGLVLGMVAVVTAGAVGAAAGIRPIEHEEEEVVAVDDEEVEVDEEAAAEIPDDAEVFVAVDNAFNEAPDTVPAGEVTLAIDNQGNLHHDVTIEELGDQTVLEADGGLVDVDTVDLPAGTYTYYCSVPGHRATMEGTLTAE